MAEPLESAPTTKAADGAARNAPPASPGTPSPHGLAPFVFVAVVIGAFLLFTPDLRLGVIVIAGLAVVVWLINAVAVPSSSGALDPALLQAHLYPFDQERPPPTSHKIPEALASLLRKLPMEQREQMELAWLRGAESSSPGRPPLTPGSNYYDDIVLGTRLAEPRGPLVLSRGDQAQHSLVWGTTGSGKSMFLLTQILQHISRHHAICLLDPHGDLSLDCLRHLAAGGFFNRPDAFQRLVYIDFSEDRHAPFNVLATRFRPHTRALNALEAFTRTWPEIQTAPHFRTLFLSSAMILIANGLPLTDINRLLLDDDFRKQCLARVSDPLVRQVSEFFEKGPSGQAGSTLRRSFLLGFSPVIRGCLSQTENVFDMRRMMDAGVSLIVNLGSIEQLEVRRLMGSLLMVQIEQAALSRADLPQDARSPWTCFVDEWPQMAATQGESLEHLLTQARKYNLRLCLAGQSPAQIDSGRLTGALEQWRLSVTFRLGAESAKRQAQEMVTYDPHNPDSTPASQVRLLAPAIQGLDPRLALVSMAGERVKPLKTLLVQKPTLEPSALAGILDTYHRTYQRPAAPDSFADLLTPPLQAGDVLRMEGVLRDVGGPLSNFSAYFGEDADHGAGDTFDA